MGGQCGHYSSLDKDARHTRGQDIVTPGLQHHVSSPLQLFDRFHSSASCPYNEGKTKSRDSHKSFMMSRDDGTNNIFVILGV